MPWPETALLPVARTDASAALLPSLLPLTRSPCTVHRRKLGKFAPNAACAGLVQLGSALPRLRAFCAWSEPADSAVWGDHVAGLQSSCIRSLRCPPPAGSSISRLAPSQQAPSTQPRRLSRAAQPLQPVPRAVRTRGGSQDVSRLVTPPTALRRPRTAHMKRQPARP